MNTAYSYREKPRLFCCSWRPSRLLTSHYLLRVNPFLINLLYFVSLSFLGFGILKYLNPRTTLRSRNIDLFFTSVSAVTVSSMSTVEMEVFSNSQLIVMTALMFFGGEILFSMIGLHLRSSVIVTAKERVEKITSLVQTNPCSLRLPANFSDQTESCTISTPDSDSNPSESHHTDSIKLLGSVVLGYLLVNHVVGIGSVLIYLARVKSAEEVLRTKRLKTFTFAMFTIVSTFSNCGFIPTNENMIAFRKNPGLLWILILQILLGNTLFPSALRVVLRVLSKRFKKRQIEYLLQNTEEVEYVHLLPSLKSMLLVVTVFGFLLVGFVMFCSMEWNSEALQGMTTYQKAVGVIFQCTNARHSGETIVDLSTIAPAILVFFIFMMYLPPYTLFLPIKMDEERPSLTSERREKGRKNIAETLAFSQLTYLVIFIILICITERKSLKEDPLNFSVLNIVVEVISAYGNVGFTTGYSCERQLRPDQSCMNKWYGFSGKWSDKGKVILIIVMLFGKLKTFNKNGGQAWRL